MSCQGQAACLYGQQIMSKLKGYKLNVKDFRRNMLLKTRADHSKNNKSTPILQLSPKPQNKTKNKYQLESPHYQQPNFKNMHTNSFFHHKKYKSNIDSTFSSHENYENHLNSQISNNHRIDEYLTIILKKVKNDSNKLMKELAKKQQKNNHKKKYCINDHQTFIKRIKLQSRKNKSQKFAEKSIINHTQNPQTITNNNLLQIIKKVQQLPYPSKPPKIPKLFPQKPNQKKRSFSSIQSSPHKQPIKNNSLPRQKTQKTQK